MPPYTTGMRTRACDVFDKQAVDLYRQISEEKKKDGIQVDKEAVALHL